MHQYFIIKIIKIGAIIFYILYYPSIFLNMLSKQKNKYKTYLL
jgi:hypothetical protein